MEAPILESPDDDIYIEDKNNAIDIIPANEAKYNENEIEGNEINLL